MTDDDYDDYEESESEGFPLFEAPLRAVRTGFTGLATMVYGWPSNGGVWVHKSCYGVELDFLNLSRFETSVTERFSEKEDAFCKRLEQIGGQFYESEDVYNKRGDRPQHVRVQDLQSWYGWPSTMPEGGLWALWMSELEGAEAGISRIRNALTMEERCRAIEMLGGKFYNNWEDVAEAKMKFYSNEK